ncbi:Dot/Icm T4SS effector E3 ubiquitin ligase LubX/LegU2 [Legionella pneumophila serogroup 1]
MGYRIEMATRNPFDIDHKSKYLREAALEANLFHPETTPTMLTCPIDSGFLKDPVITPEGFVYNKSSILKWLETKKEDPQSRKPLTAKDLQPFPELLIIVNRFVETQTNYEKLKNRLVQNARVAARQKESTEIPDIFLCPISKTLIKTPVITAQGKVYDQEALSNFLIATGNKDETGKKLSIDDVVVFDELYQQIKVYNFYRKREMQKNQIQPSVSSGFGFFSLNFLTSWLWGTEEKKEKTSSDMTY